MCGILTSRRRTSISTDHVDRDHITAVQRWNINEVRRFMIVFGLMSSAFDLLTFLVLLKFHNADEPTFQTAWFVVSLLTELAVLLVLRTSRPAWRSIPGRLLLGSTVAVGALALALPYVQPLASVFSFTALSWKLVGTLMLIVTSYVICTEIGKALFFRRRT